MQGEWIGTPKSGVITMVSARSSTEVSKTGMGTVVWFDPKAGYGFIKPDERGPDIFARLPANKGVVTTLTAGDRVSYELVTFGKPTKTQAVIRIDANFGH